MTRETAINAYRRISDWEQREARRLRELILVPVFGGCGCRMHNCKVNYESGRNEGPQHHEQYKAAKLHAHLEAKRYETYHRLADAFAKHF